MLGVTFTTRAELDDVDTRRKNGKKEKKKKKDKRNKKGKREKRSTSNSSGESVSDDDGWRGQIKSSDDVQDAAAGAQDVGNKEEADAEPLLQREDWMSKPMKRESTKTAQQMEAEEEEKHRGQAAAAEPEVVAGLRVMRKPDNPGQGTVGAPSSAAAAVSGAGSGLGGGLVGDGGASWRLKALRRAQEQARAEGRSLHEVVGERWGSLAKLTGDLSATAAADGKAHLRAAAERRRAATEGVPAIVPHYLQDVRSDKGKMLRPADDASLGWRRDRDRDSRNRHRDHDRYRDRDGQNGQEERPAGRSADYGGGDAPGGRRGQPGRDDGHLRDEPRGGVRGREGNEREHLAPGHSRGAGEARDASGSRRGSRDHHRHGDGRDSNQPSDSREREGRVADRNDQEMKAMAGDERNRHGDGNREREQQRGRQRNRDEDQDWGQEQPGHRGGGRDPAPGGSRAAGSSFRPSKEQRNALQQLAGSLNTFTDDGSFMDRFMASQHGARSQQQRDPEQVVGVGIEADMAPAERGGPGAAGPAGGSGVAGVSASSSGNQGVAALLKGGRRVGGQEGHRPERKLASAADDAVGVRDGGGDGGGRGGDGGGGGGDGGGGGGSDEDRGEQTVAATSRRAPLFVGAEDNDAGPNRAGGCSDSGGGGGEGGIGNKSAAELLRARLKGLPLPSSAGNTGDGAGAPAKFNPVGGPGRPGRAEGTSFDDGGTSSGGATRHGGNSDAAAPTGRATPHREVVQLPLVDARGRAVRGAFGREAAGAGTAPDAGRRAGTKPPERYNRQTGEKERYFADDDKVDLQTMLRRAKYGDDDMDMDEHLAANIAKKRKFRGKELDADAEYDYDGGLEMYENRTKRGSVEAQRNRERSRQVADLRRQAAAEAGCTLCLSNPNRPKHMAIALGTCAYLSLPHRGRLVRGHCCIAPSEHCPSIRGLDEAAWTEVKNFIKCIIRMYGAQGQSVIFMETYMTRSGGRHHAVLDAVPVTERQLEKARGYFKKAILEAESEWSTHHAKACIETSAQKGLRESIPPNFPYFYVQFGYGSGYVHVIDDETKFDPNFGRQVLIGLLDLPPEMAYQRHKAESLATQQQWVREFEAQWDLYDWTRQLDAA